MGRGVFRTAFFAVVKEFQPIVRELGWLDADAVFNDPRIKVWRSIKERENCLLDLKLSTGESIRWHIKRDKKQMKQSVADEATALKLVQDHGIPSMTLVAVGRMKDGRSFLITENLKGYEDAEKLVEKGMDFDRLLDPTAKLAANLHNSGLHHRDLYLCHFFANPKNPQDMRLIDVGRLKELPRIFTNRWIVKDLGEFWYSTLRLNITDKQREKWLRKYCSLRRPELKFDRYVKSVIHKSNMIKKHDYRLKLMQPGRNIALEP